MLPPPIIPADKNIVEITVKAVILGIILSMLLAAANAYIGLLVGLTVSASIPATAVAIYLPLGLSVPIFIGGLIVMIAAIVMPLSTTIAMRSILGTIALILTIIYLYKKPYLLRNVINE